MFAKPQAEHRWLEQLVGNWTVETESKMGPDQPMQKMTSDLSCRTLEGMWVVLESGVESKEKDGTWSTLMTLGFDPAQAAYVGTFIGSMMGHLWLYKGSLDASGKKLTLDSTGPAFDREGTAEYQDIVEVVDKDHWILSSQLQMPDGSWEQFMTAHHRRK